MAGRRGAVVEDDSYNKRERLNVQERKKYKILAEHVQRICEAHDTVMRSYYQQIHKKIGDFWVLARILKNCTYKPRVYMYIFPPKNQPCRGKLRSDKVKDIPKTRLSNSGRLGLMRRRRWRTLENKCMCK